MSRKHVHTSVENTVSLKNANHHLSLGKEPIHLFNTGWTQTFHLHKMRHLRNAIKWSMPIFGITFLIITPTISTCR